ncbi:MAG: DUF6691 family protein [Nitrospirota bacterium]
MTAPLIVSQNVGLVLAVLLGIFFGLFLERGGLGNPHKLTGVFYLRDFTVPKVMFTAIIVACSGLYLLSDLKFLDISRVWIVPTFFWPQLAGGALFGIGFVLSGYCPGTAVAGIASGRLDALVTIAGIGAGSFLFAVLYPYIEGFYNSSAMGGVTLHGLLKINHWAVIAFLYIFAGGMFYLMERYERRG